MGSVGAPNPWAPFDSYKDCTQGICSIYCPQWCYLIFPPPPPYDDDSGTPFSPLIIAIIGVLASAFLLISYYTIVTRYCKRRRDRNRGIEPEENRDDMAENQWQGGSAGLDDALIKTITVCKYTKGEGLIEGTECAVCLSEFQESESLRLLPKCSHAFHLPCIDTWLKSHSNCPLCRANVVSPIPPPSNPNSSTVNVSAFEIHRPDDLILVVEDPRFDHCQETLLSHEVQPKSPSHSIIDAEDQERGNDITGSDQEGTKHFRRSSSLGTFSSQRHLLISDILRIEEADEELQLQSCTSSSKGIVGIRRSISTSRFLDKGKKSITPS